MQDIPREPSIEETIVHEITLGQTREVKSTPTWFISSLGREQRLDGGLPYQVSKDYFDRIVK